MDLPLPSWIIRTNSAGRHRGVVPNHHGHGRHLHTLTSRLSRQFIGNADVAAVVALELVVEARDGQSTSGD